MIWSPPKDQQKDPIPFAAPIFVLKSIWWIDASTPPRGFLVRNFWLHRKVHPVLWRFPWHHVSGDMLNLRGVRRCFVVFCGVQKDGGDVLCLFFSELGQILTKKCSENENKRFFFTNFVFFDYKLRPQPGVNSGILKNRQNHTIGRILFKKRWDCVEVLQISFFSTRLPHFSTCLNDAFGPAFVVSQFEVLNALHRSVALKALQIDAWPEDSSFRPNDHSKIVANL